MTQHWNKLLILCLTCILLALATVPALASEDNSITFGLKGIPTIEYERRFSEAFTGFISYGYMNDERMVLGPVLFFSGEASVTNVGFKLYARRNSFRGIYLGMGVGQYYLNGRTWWNNPYYTNQLGYELLFGYKKAFESGLTLEAGVDYVIIQNNKDWNTGYGLVLKGGYSW